MLIRIGGFGKLPWYLLQQLGFSSIPVFEIVAKSKPTLFEEFVGTECNRLVHRLDACKEWIAVEHFGN